MTTSEQYEKMWWDDEPTRKAWEMVTGSPAWHFISSWALTRAAEECGSLPPTAGSDIIAKASMQQRGVIAALQFLQNAHKKPEPPKELPPAWSEGLIPEPE